VILRLSNKDDASTTGWLDVAFTVDRSYFWHAIVAIASLVLGENSRHIRSIYLVVLGVPERTLRRAERWATQGGIADKIVVVRAGSEGVEKGLPYAWLSVSAYLRWLIPELLPNTVRTVLYLDADTIVRRDLGYLKPIMTALQKQAPPGSSFPVAAVKESDGAALKSFGFSDNSYFNAGVMLLNLDAWRVQEVAKQLWERIDLAPELPIPDQDIMNLALEGKWLPLAPEINGLPQFAHAGTVVAHFAGYRKPWMTFCSHPHRGDYRRWRRKARGPFWLPGAWFSGLRYMSRKTLVRTESGRKVVQAWDRSRGRK
jgi:lipopolysaccharide biosynthesis glycosyltransferase